MPSSFSRKTIQYLFHFVWIISACNFGITIFIFHRRGAFSASPDDGAITIRRQQHHKETYTLVVVRCKGNLTWFDDVPSNWRILVYEKCQNTAFTPYSVLTAVQAGSDECNGYLDYLVDYYENLTSINVFMHDDALWGYSRHRGINAHTPFDNFRQVMNATKNYLNPSQGYVTYGVRTKEENFGGDPAHAMAQKVLWPFLRSDDNPNPPEVINYKPSAHFAVRKEAIQSRPKSTYEALLKLVRYSKDVPGHYLDSRRLCWSMERSWHMLFGETPDLPMKTRVFDMMINDNAITKEEFKWNAYDGF